MTATNSTPPSGLALNLQERLVALQGECRSIVEEKTGSRLARLNVPALLISPRAGSTSDRLRWLADLLGGGAFEPFLRDALHAAGLPASARSPFTLKTPSHHFEFSYFSLTARGLAAPDSPVASLSVPLWTAELGHWSQGVESAPALVQAALSSFCAGSSERAAIPFLGPMDLQALCDAVVQEHPNLAPRPKALTVQSRDGALNFDYVDLIRDLVSASSEAHPLFIARLTSALEAKDLALEAALQTTGSAAPEGSAAKSPAKAAARL